jgi:hypothetical protein
MNGNVRLTNSPFMHNVHNSQKIGKDLKIPSFLGALAKFQNLPWVNSFWETSKPIGDRKEKKVEKFNVIFPKWTKNLCCPPCIALERWKSNKDCT